MKIIKLLFLALIILMPLGEITRIDIGNNTVIKINDIVLFLTVFSYAIYYFLNKNKDKSKNNLSKPILIFSIIGLVSLLINFSNLKINEFFVSILYLIRWLLYAGIYFVVSSFDYNFKKRIPIYLMISSLIVLFLGYFQYFFYPSLRNLYYLGWDEHLYRMFSSFLDPNFFGSFLVLILILNFGLLMLYKNIKSRALFLLSGLLIFNAVFLTYSRSALIMLFISIMVFLILIKKARLILLLIITFFVIFLFMSKNFYIENLNLLRTASSKARIDSSNTALKIIEKNPIMGVGFNAYRYAQLRYGFKKENSNIPNHSDSGTDNSFLFVLATTGIVGFISYLYLLLAIIKTTVNNLNAENNFNKIFSVVIISSFSGMIVNSIFINSLFYTFIMEWIWILLGINYSGNLLARESK